MCFHISINSKKEIIEQEMNATFDDSFDFQQQSHISAFSNPNIPVITNNKSHKIQLYYWGLIPEWVKDIKTANNLRKMTYNARYETITEKPSFKKSIQNKCLIIADGFYEWETIRNGKICHFINNHKNNIFAFAGIYSHWINKFDNKIIKTVSIITQPANRLMSKIHNIKKRQPVVLHKHNHEKWLNSCLDYIGILKESYNIVLNNKIVKSPL